jgi:hypothetical protein
LVGEERIELSLLAKHDFELSVSINSSYFIVVIKHIFLV